jgi:hypothetical protein
VNSFVPIVLTFLVTSPAMARDIWIHAVGINTSSKSQNQSGFYVSAQDFLTACNSSNKNPECHLFINPDPQYMAIKNLSKEQLAFSLNDGPASSQKVLAALKNAIATAGPPPNTIILSLQNHGAPREIIGGPELIAEYKKQKFKSESEEKEFWNRNLRPGNSCISLNDEDRVCDNDLIPILEKAPPGTTILVNADGCYSGAFANVAKANACAVTATDQLHFGIGGQDSFWKNISHNEAKNLDELRAPVRTGNSWRISSQTIMRSLCKKSREKVLSIEVNKILENLNMFTAVRDSSCSKDIGEGERLIPEADLSNEINLLPKFLTNQSCQILELPNSACLALKRLQKLDPKISRKLAELGKGIEEYNQAESDLDKIGKSEMGKVDDSNVRTAIDLVVQGEVPLDFYNKWKTFPKIQEVAAPLLQQKAHATIAHAAARDSILDALKELQTTQAYDDWLVIHACLLPNDQDDLVLGGNSQTDEWNEIARNSVPIHFTEADYEKARQCERKVSF